VSRQSFDDEQIIEAASGDDEFAGRARFTNGELGLDYSRPFSDKMEVQLLMIQRLGSGVSSSAARLSQGFTSDFQRRERDGESIVRTRLSYRPSGVVEIEAGGEGAFNFLDGRTDYAEDGEAIELPSANARVEELRGEIFAQAKWKPSSRVAIELGSKLELSRISLNSAGSRSKTFVYPKPRLTLNLTPYDSSQLRLRVEREVGQLSFGDFIASAQFFDDRVFAGNADLEPQTQWVFEAAAEQRFWEKGAVTLTLRHRRISNVLDYIAIDEEFEAIGNIGNGTGLEAVATFTAPMDRLLVRGLTLRANGTWRNSKVTDPLTGESRRISGQRPFEGSIGFTHDVAAWNASYGFDANAGWEESYWRLKEITDSSLTHWYRLFAEYKPSPVWSIRAEYVNLDEYRRRRTLFAGLRELSEISIIEDRSIPPPPRYNLRLRRKL
jgi:outer membrane receptor protein involved in Fe transport